MTETTPRTIYRWSSIGLALTDALDDLVIQNRIEPQLARKIQVNFDQVITSTLQSRVRGRIRFTGHLDTYRFCDDVWTFLIRDMTWNMDGNAMSKADKVKIVCCKSQAADN